MSERAPGGLAHARPLTLITRLGSACAAVALVSCGGGGGGASTSTPPLPPELPSEAGRVLVRPAAVATVGQGSGQPLAELPLAAGLEDLASFVRIAHRVQFFHPSDGVAETNWDEFLQLGMYQVLSRPAGMSLGARLKEIFADIAPSVRFDAATPGAELPAGKDVVAWFHLGYVDRLEAPDPEQAYSSTRKVLERARLTAQTSGPSREQLRYTLGGVTVDQPLVQVWSQGQSLPASRGLRVPASIKLSTQLSDPYLCLAVGAKAWGVLQHFYPYFPVLPGVDWNAELMPLLKACDRPADQRAEALNSALRLALTKLQDNHVGLALPQLQRPAAASLPVRFDEVEGRPVVIYRRAAAGDIQAGDELLAINGEPMAQYLARLTPTSLRNSHLNASALLTRAGVAELNSLVQLTLRDAEGRSYTRSVKADQDAAMATEANEALRFGREPLTRWLDAKVLYVNLSDMAPEQRATVEQEMVKASAWVLDLRRYPKDGDMTKILARFAPGAIKSLPLRHIEPHDPEALPRRPDIPQGDEGKDAKLHGPALVLSSRNSQSFNEHMLGFAQSAGLKIMGERTSGANGDITYIRMSQLPQFALVFTGLEVRQHDGSVFHARGIQPDLVQGRSMASLRSGRDEVLEAAYARVKAQLPP